MKTLVAFLLIGLLGCSSGESEKDTRKRSPHFKDGIFHNAKKIKKKKFRDVVNMRLKTSWAKWPEWVDVPTGAMPTKRVSGSETRVTFINHATFLIQTNGYNILTDPIYSRRCSPVSFVGPKRVHRPAIPFDNLPKIDVILISHDHYDHLDFPTLSRLVSRDRPRIYVGLGVAGRFDRQDNITELDWWESVPIGEKFRLTFTEVRHFSGRTLTDRYSTLWGGFVLEIGDKKIYFGGDSGYGDHYKTTYKKFGPMDLALLPIGAYAPRFFMADVHIDPRQAVMAHLDLRSRKSIGMHYGTFRLTAEPRNAPPELLEKEKKKFGVPKDDFITLELGKVLVLP